MAHFHMSLVAWCGVRRCCVAYRHWRAAPCRACHAHGVSNGVSYRVGSGAARWDAVAPAGSPWATMLNRAGATAPRRMRAHRLPTATPLKN
eukprot:4290064-Prymnesium_polylepis.1